MTTKIAFGLLAFITMFATIAGTATADESKPIVLGKTLTLTNGGATIVVFVERTPAFAYDEDECHLKLVAGGSAGFREDGNWGYLTAESSEAGTTVITNGPSAKTKWKLVELSGREYWTFLHADNGANALTHSPGALKLRRNNAGGKGNSDQLWKLESFR